MTLRLQTFLSGLFALIAAALLALAPAQAKPASGGYQLFEQVVLADSQAIQLAALGNFDYHAKIAPECCNATNRTVDDLLKGLDPLPGTGGRTTQYPKSGGFDQANADFDALGLSNVREISMPNGGTGRVGQLPDGTRVVVRSGSSENRPGFTSQPTLEIQYPDGPTKIRY